MSPTQSHADGASALDGLRVLDLASLFPAPLLAAMMGDMGADVIKVEPPTGDPLRGLGVKQDGKSLTWAAVGRNKRSVTLNLADARSRPLLTRLIEGADVLIENFPRDAVERFGLGYEQLKAINPRLVVATVSCYGVSGPYKDDAGNGTLAEAYAGLTHMIGDADGPPMLPSVALGDAIAATSGLNGVLAALYRRDAGKGGSGEGQHVDVTIYEPVLQIMINSVLRYGATGVAERRFGSRLPGSAPRNVYRTRDDSYVVISALTDRVVKRLLDCMNIATPENLQRFGTAAARAANENAMDQAVADWVATQDRAHVISVLAAARIPVSPVNDMADVFADPHIQARSNLTEVVDPDLGAVRMLAPSPRLSATPSRVRSTGPAIGQHNAEVYGALGFDTAQLDALRAAGVI
jgi:crotonobetainyl-CoA:carnitine CoA-transferase CaiB-like acyl-CoA transferase